MELINIVLIVVIIILIITVFSCTCEGFNGYYIAQPTKCFSCERELPDDKKYMGGATKCFSCERELAQRYGGNIANLARSSKCYSCEQQMGPGLSKIVQ